MVEITQLGRHGIEDRESRKIVLGTHTGTHCDAPSHFIPGAQTVDEIPLDTLVGPAYVADFTKAAPFQEISAAELEKSVGGRTVERLLLRFDWSDHWGKMAYYTDHPFISEDACHWLVDKGIRVLGMDTPMPDNPKNGWGDEIDSPNHKILLGNGIILLEYLCNLKSLRKSEIDLVALPLKIRDGDGAPIRCIAIEK